MLPKEKCTCKPLSCSNHKPLTIPKHSTAFFGKRDNAEERLRECCKRLLVASQSACIGFDRHGQQPHGRCYRRCGCRCRGEPEEIKSTITIKMTCRFGRSFALFTQSILPKSVNQRGVGRDDDRLITLVDDHAGLRTVGLAQIAHLCDVHGDVLAVFGL